MNFREIITDVMHAYEIQPEAGKTILFIWENEQHLKEWSDHVELTKEMKKLVVPSDFMQELHTGELNRDAVCIVGLAFGLKEDYSDVRCVYYMAVQVY